MVNFRDLLKGCRLHKDADGNIIVQSILNMQLVCLTTDSEFSYNKFANPMDVLASNQRYGHLNLANTDNKDMIVPAQIAVLTKQSAQNHGMVKAAYIPSKSRSDFYDAGCVQGSQTGHISASKNDQEVRFLPFGVREYIWDKVNKTGSHDNIYAAIDKVGRDTGANSGTYIDQYFKKFDKEINEFIAHFERPKNTIGTIVLIDGEIIAIDKFPSFEYCEQVWDALIRDCYGAIAITQERQGKKAQSLFTQNMAKQKRKANETPAAYLKRVMTSTKKSIEDNVRAKLEEILELSFSEKQDTDLNGKNGYTSKILTTEGYIGQKISESNFHHLVSVVRKESFDPERFRKANEMRSKASKQRGFEI